MAIKAEELAPRLAKGIAPIYLVSGDEPLLSIECCDQIRAAAREAGFVEREVFDSDRIDWDQVLNESRSMSLFSDRRILEIRLKGKLGTEGSKAVVEICRDLPDDLLILLVTGKLEASQKGSKWVKTIESVGEHVQIWPVKPHQLPFWLSDRLKRAGIRANRQAVDVLAERVEGNLLAARQEIEKLLLVLDEDEVDAQAMSSAVADSARYDVFTLVDRILAGEVEEVSRSLRGLRDEGNDPLALLWVLTRELRTLVRIREAMDAGQSFDTCCKRERVWQSRQRLVRGALNRLPLNRLLLLLRQARLVDELSKGALPGDPWLEIENLVLGFCGHGVRDRETTRLGLATTF